METRKVNSFLNQFLTVSLGLAVIYLVGNRAERGRSFWAVAALIPLLALGGWLIGRLARKPGKLKLSIPDWLAGALSALFQLGLLAAFFTQDIQLVNSGIGRLLLAVLAAGGAALLFLAVRDTKVPQRSFITALLIFGALYRLAAFLPELQAGPFALGWSEGSRFYNASLFLSERIYGQKLPLPVLHPSRYLMQALPFLLGVKSILAHRVWQVLLWLGMSAWGAYLCVRRFGRDKGVSIGLLTIWGALFFFQGAVYYHLMVCVILVLLGYRKDKVWRTLAFVVLASVWAGISRVNWMPLPGLLAGLLYLMDQPFDGKKWPRYLMPVLLWAAVGFGSAWLAQQGYIRVSGEDPALFNSAFSSALIWQRLLPNATFGLGILPAVLLVCLPGLGLLGQLVERKQLPRLHWLRWMGLTGILSVFFLGGLLVSLKIGGGGDLHNLDGFLVLWFLAAGSLLTGAYAPDGPLRPPEPIAAKVPFWLLLAALVPLYFALSHPVSWGYAKLADQRADVKRMQAVLDQLREQPGEVLFISERQLLSFHELQGVRVVPEYEKVFLMEMAMGNNQPYLQRFYTDLASHRFKAIITDTISTRLQGEANSFGIENDAWVTQVLQPMLLEYEPVLSWNNENARLLIPLDQDALKEKLQQFQP